MKPSIQAPLDQLTARLAALEANLARTKAELRTLVMATSGTMDAEFISLSGTIDAEFVYLSGTVNSAVVALSGTIDAKFLAGYRLLAIQEFTGSTTYVPTPGTVAVRAHIVGSGGGGGPGTTVAGAAGGGGASGEWAVVWYAPGTQLSGQAVNIGAAAASAAAGNTSGIMIDGITFAAIGGTAGSTNTAAGSYGEAAAVALGTSGSTAFDLYRGSSFSANAMMTIATGGTPTGFTAGIGGGTPYGRGGRGSGGDAVGENGIGAGAGGGGGRRGSTTNRNGGTSAPGLVIVEEYGR